MQKEVNWDWDSLREHAYGHKERRWICPISHPWFKKNASSLGISTSKEEAQQLKESAHERRWLKIFQPDKEEFSHLEKMPKREAAQKVDLKSRIQKFWKKGIESQLLGPLKRGWSVGDFQGGNLKGGNNEKIRKGPATNVAYTTLVLVPRAVSGGNQ